MSLKREKLFWFLIHAWSISLSWLHTAHIEFWWSQQRVVMCDTEESLFNVTVFSFHSSHGTLHLKGNMACDANWTGWICRDWLNTQKWVTIGSLGIIPEYRRCLKHWQNIGTACKAKYRQKMITWAKLMFWSVILLHRRTVCIRSISSGASILTKFRSWWWLEWWHDYVSLQWLSVSRHVRR